MNEEFVFYRENSIKNRFSLTAEEFLSKFKGWLVTKDGDWLTYYCGNLHRYFIADTEGLNSTVEDEAYYDTLFELTKEIKWDYLNELGVSQ